MKTVKNSIFLLCILLQFNILINPVSAQIKHSDVPFMGAQVFIEPGQTAAQIDGWFKTLKENDFSVCRIRMFESYMNNGTEDWDFTLFDHAFKAADKYGIKVYATLFPWTEKTDIGGFKFPRDKAHLESIAVYIEKTVTHFSRYESMFGWVLINEPGSSGIIPESDFSVQKMKEWKNENPPKEYDDNGYPVLVDFTEESFLLDYTTWFLNWLSDEIKKYDSERELHVNNHATFSNCAEYDFPAWRPFLTSLGASAHPSWHFGYFPREKYHVAMSANSEIIYSGAGELPWIMTELQGGNNTYSGLNPMCPTKEEIAQWLWITYTTEAKGVIFWSLNPRNSGIEAGEWALLDFHDKPSDRMLEAAKITNIIEEYQDEFTKAQKIESGIHILYVHESLWAEAKMTLYPSNFEARNQGGVMKSSLAYFEAFGEMGIGANLGEIGEFDFSKSDYSGEVLILAHQISVPGYYVAALDNFVKKGGKLIVDGLTAFYDENMHNTMATGFDFAKLFGGSISEFKFVKDIFPLEIEGISLAAHLWKGYVVAKKGKLIYGTENDAIGLRNSYGTGEVLWIPSPLGLGSRITDDYSNLCKILTKETSSALAKNPVMFKTPHRNVLMKTMQAGEKYITTLINKDEDTRIIDLKFKDKGLRPTLIYSSFENSISGNEIQLLPEETKVIIWE